MRRLLLVWMFILLIPFGLGLDLEDYPENFFRDGEFNGKIVVGEAGPTMDITSAVMIVPSLQALSEERIKGAVLDSDVSDYDLQGYSILSVGNACGNKITAEIMGITANCAKFFNDGEGYIYLFESDLGKPWLVVAGGTPEDTAKAANVLGNYQQYVLSGNAWIVKGNSAPYTLVETTLPGKPTEIVKEITKSEEEVEVSENSYNEDNYGIYREPEEREENIAEKLQRETEEEIKEIEERNKIETEEEPEQQVDGPLHAVIWEKFKSWLGWFFR